jgi:hypothetical protein
MATSDLEKHAERLRCSMDKGLQGLSRKPLRRAPSCEYPYTRGTLDEVFEVSPFCATSARPILNGGHGFALLEES